MVQSFGTAYTLGQGTGNTYEYLRKHTWEVQIDTLDSVLSAKSVTLPVTKVEEGKLFHANEQVKYAMKPTPGDLTVVFHDVITPSIHDELLIWWQQVYNSMTGQMGIASNYKRQGSIFLYDPQWNLIRTWTIIGMWPKNEPAMTEAYDYEKQDPATLDMTFGVDRVTPNGGTVNTVS